MNRTIHIKIVSAFYALAALLFIFLGFSYFLALDWLKASFVDNTYIQNMDRKESILWGVGLLLIAMIECFFAYKIFKGSNVAKTIALVISVIGIIWAVYGLFVYGGIENIFFLSIHLYFTWALKSTK